MNEPAADRLARYRRLFDLRGRTALVLGAASGIGRASAEVLAALGATVLCADRDAAGVRAAAAAVGNPGGAHVVDAASPADIQSLAETVKRGHKRLDVALTTPAINIRKRLLDYADEEYERVVDLNLGGTFRFLREFGRIMAAQGGGSLIACSSMRATTLEPGLSVYAATKAAIVQLVRGLASEVGPMGVRVNAIVPSIVDTALTAPLKDKPEIYKTYAAHTVFNRWAAPDEVAGAVAFLACDAASYVTGSALVVDGGWTAIDGPATGLTQTAPNR